MWLSCCRWPDYDRLRGGTLQAFLNLRNEIFVARATVWHALDKLTPRRRAVLVMHELEGLTIPAIASLLGITPSQSGGIYPRDAARWRAFVDLMEERTMESVRDYVARRRSASS
jgi:hypothetical protein